MRHFVPALLLVLSSAALAQQSGTGPWPKERGSSCPSGYHSSGNYCVPSSDSARAAIPKSGSCPSGYHSSGAFCLASSDSAKTAIMRSGSCPSGFHSSGDYCLKN